MLFIEHHSLQVLLNYEGNGEETNNKIQIKKPHLLVIRFTVPVFRVK